MSHSYILTYFAVRFSLTFIFSLNTSLLLSVLLFGSAETPFSGLFSFANAFIRLFSSRQYNSARYSLGIKKARIKNLTISEMCLFRFFKRWEILVLTWKSFSCDLLYILKYVPALARFAWVGNLEGIQEKGDKSKASRKLVIVSLPLMC